MALYDKDNIMHFIDEIIDGDIKSGKYKYGDIITRYPPEPNGYIHIGHVKAFWIDYSMAAKYGGKCNLRYDDTNPTKEDEEFVDAIQHDIKWLGFDWANIFYGSDYFGQCYELAVKLIEKGVAYVCDLSRDEIRQYRGTLTTPGKNSPYRDRSVEENLDLFRRMKEGEFENGEKTLRAKIDMASPNMNMRDPAMYRIIHISHHNTGDEWCIYPMYDFAHPVQDAIEGITHSLCSMEYEDHRPLYDWFIDQCEFERKPRQIEFARLNITNTVMSKRYLRRLVEGGHVSGWDDPRMPTITGMRRRGYTPEAILDFVQRAGVAKAYSVVDAKLLEHCVREYLNEHAIRATAVLDPVKLVIENYPEGKVEEINFDNHPAESSLGSHSLSFAREVFIEREDFMEDPPKKFFRLTPGKEVRLRGAYIIKCERVEKDEEGNITAIICTYDPESKSGMEGANRKIKGTLHWLSALDAKPALVRLYDYMIKDPQGEGEDEPEDEYLGDHSAAADSYAQNFNEDSIVLMEGALVSPMLAQCAVGERFQFVRQGYFIKDRDSTEKLPVFNRTVSLKDSYRP
ncbi:MAG: glutamine--tRNA ligase/YqeY domain fusion protein [Christensenellales bacterium]|jgi:glutaminyl-tRNA synthetase